MYTWMWIESAEYQHFQYLVNVNQIAFLDPQAHSICVGAVQENHTGILHLTKESFNKLLDVITQRNTIYGTKNETDNNNNIIRKD